RRTESSAGEIWARTRIYKFGRMVFRSFVRCYEEIEVHSYLLQWFFKRCTEEALSALQMGNEPIFESSKRSLERPQLSERSTREIWKRKAWSCSPRRLVQNNEK